MSDLSVESLFHSVEKLLKRGLSEEQLGQELRGLITTCGGEVRNIKTLLNGHGIGTQTRDSILKAFHLPKDIE